MMRICTGAQVDEIHKQDSTCNLEVFSAWPHPHTRAENSLSPLKSKPLQSLQPSLSRLRLSRLHALTPALTSYVTYHLFSGVLILLAQSTRPRCESVDGTGVAQSGFSPRELRVTQANCGRVDTKRSACVAIQGIMPLICLGSSHHRLLRYIPPPSQRSFLTIIPRSSGQSLLIRRLERSLAPRTRTHDLRGASTTVCLRAMCSRVDRKRSARVAIQGIMHLICLGSSHHRLLRYTNLGSHLCDRAKSLAPREPLQPLRPAGPKLA